MVSMVAQRHTASQIKIFVRNIAYIHKKYGIFGKTF